MAKFTAALLDAGAEAATARSRQLAVRRFSAWLAAEGETPADQLAGMAPPKLDAKAVEPLSDDQLRALIAACKGPDLRDKRDEAIVRLMAEAGLLRYTAARAQQRTAEEARSLGLGDL